MSEPTSGPDPPGNTDGLLCRRPSPTPAGGRPAGPVGAPGGGAPGACSWVPCLPDLLLVGSAGCCWRELKCGSTWVTAAQASWLDALEAAWQDVAVWGPLDLADGTIAGKITALNSRPG